MDILKQLYIEHSLANTQKISEYILKNPTKFPELLKALKSDDITLSQRASWPFTFIAHNNHALISPFLPELVKLLKKKGIHDAVKRNGTKILMEIKIPVKLKGKIVDLCFEYLLSKSEKVAVQANAMSIIFILCKNEIEILKELKIILEDRYQYSSPAFTSRAGKILKEIKKML